MLRLMTYLIVVSSSEILVQMWIEDVQSWLLFLLFAVSCLPDFHTTFIMSASIPKANKAWTVEGKEGFESLKLNSNAPVPRPSDYEVLVKFHAASLNYRDLIIPKGTFEAPPVGTSI